MQGGGRARGCHGKENYFTKPLDISEQVAIDSCLTMQLNALVKIMKRAKWTSADVESICAVTRRTVWNWRTGRTLPKANDIAHMLAALNKQGIAAEFGDFLPKIRKAA